MIGKKMSEERDENPEPVVDVISEKTPLAVKVIQNPSKPTATGLPKSSTKKSLDKIVLNLNSNVNQSSQNENVPGCTNKPSIIITSNQLISPPQTTSNKETAITASTGKTTSETTQELTKEISLVDWPKNTISPKLSTINKTPSVNTMCNSTNTPIIDKNDHDIIDIDVQPEPKEPDEIPNSELPMNSDPSVLEQETQRSVPLGFEHYFQEIYLQIVHDAQCKETKQNFPKPSQMDTEPSLSKPPSINNQPRTTTFNYPTNSNGSHKYTKPSFPAASSLYSHILQQEKGSYYHKNLRSRGIPSLPSSSIPAIDLIKPQRQPNKHSSTTNDTLQRSLENMQPFNPKFTEQTPPRSFRTKNQTQTTTSNFPTNHSHHLPTRTQPLFPVASTSYLNTQPPGKEDYNSQSLHSRSLVNNSPTTFDPSLNSMRFQREQSTITSVTAQKTDYEYVAAFNTIQRNLLNGSATLIKKAPPSHEFQTAPPELMIHGGRQIGMNLKEQTQLQRYLASLEGQNLLYPPDYSRFLADQSPLRRFPMQDHLQQMARIQHMFNNSEVQQHQRDHLQSNMTHQNYNPHSDLRPPIPKNKPFFRPYEYGDIPVNRNYIQQLLNGSEGSFATVDHRPILPNFEGIIPFPLKHLSNENNQLHYNFENPQVRQYPQNYQDSQSSHCLETRRDQGPEVVIGGSSSNLPNIANQRARLERDPRIQKRRKSNEFYIIMKHEEDSIHDEDAGFRHSDLLPT